MADKAWKEASSLRQVAQERLAGRPGSKIDCKDYVLQDFTCVLLVRLQSTIEGWGAPMPQTEEHGDGR